MSNHKRTYEELMRNCKKMNSTTITASCAFSTWKEDEITEETSNVITSGQKITHVLASFGVSARKEGEEGYNKDDEIEGKITVDWLMHYSHHNPGNPHDAIATYNGLLKFSGKINGKSGDFLCQDIGKYAAFKAASAVQILDNSGTNELAGITGHGELVASPTSAYFKLAFSFPSTSEGEKSSDSSLSTVSGPSFSRKEIAKKWLMGTATGNFEEAYSFIHEDNFKHHNIHFHGDAKSLREAQQENHVKFPNTTIEIKRLLEDDDCVASYSFVKLSDELKVMVSHCFRFNAENHIVELWDLGQVIPDSIVNENGPY
jgi:hypothetical protein